MSVDVLKSLVYTSEGREEIVRKAIDVILNMTEIEVYSLANNNFVLCCSLFGNGCVDKLVKEVSYCACVFAADKYFDEVYRWNSSESVNEKITGKDWYKIEQVDEVKIKLVNLLSAFDRKAYSLLLDDWKDNEKWYQSLFQGELHRKSEIL